MIPGLCRCGCTRSECIDTCTPDDVDRCGGTDAFHFPKEEQTVPETQAVLPHQFELAPSAYMVDYGNGREVTYPDQATMFSDIECRLGIIKRLDNIGIQKIPAVQAVSDTTMLGYTPKVHLVVMPYMWYSHDSSNSSKIFLIKAMRTLLGLGLNEAKGLVEGMTKPLIFDNVSTRIAKLLLEQVRSETPKTPLYVTSTLPSDEITFTRYSLQGE